MKRFAVETGPNDINKSQSSVTHLPCTITGLKISAALRQSVDQIKHLTIVVLQMALPQCHPVCR
jgi:hypothetical protein